MLEVKRISVFFTSHVHACTVVVGDLSRVHCNIYLFFLLLFPEAELQVAEAVALVDTLQNWTVLDKIIIPTKNPNKKFVFGKGNFQFLTGKD